jgi:hypothetical protein
MPFRLTEDRVPVLRDRRCIRAEGVAPRDAGIVDQDRDGADLALDLLRQRDAILASGHVERVAFRLAADLLCGFPRGFAVDVEGDDGGAFARVADGDGAADAGACAGNGSDV